MSSSGMLSEFLSIIGDVFSRLSDEKYLPLYAAVAVGLGASVIVYLLRWINNA